MTCQAGNFFVFSIQFEGRLIMIKLAGCPVSITMAFQTVSVTRFLKLVIMYILVATVAA
jgi:hypothetical protein